MDLRVLALTCCLVASGCSRALDLPSHAPPEQGDHRQISYRISKLHLPRQALAEPPPTTLPAVSGNLRSASLSSLIHLLLQDSHINYILEDIPEQDIAFTFPRPMALPEALYAVATAAGLQITSRDGTLVISSNDFRTFTLDYLAQGAVLPGQSFSPLNSAPVYLTDSAHASERQRIWNVIRENLSSLASEDGRVIINDLTGTILVSDNASAMRRIEAYLDMVRRLYDQQVEISVRILQISLSDSLTMGVDYSALFRVSGSDTPIAFNLHGTEGQAGASLDGTAGERGVLDYTVGVLNPGKFAGFLQFLSLHGTVHTLSNPTITTLNNVTGNVYSIRTYPYQVTTTESSANVREARTYFEDVKIGVSLTVTPNIVNNGDILLEVLPVVGEIYEENFNPASGEREKPQTVEQAIRTILRTRNNHSYFIGGLIYEKNVESTSGIPVLSRIPVLGRLFRSDRRVQSRQELVIVLTPKIIPSLDSHSAGPVDYHSTPLHYGLLEYQAGARAPLALDDHAPPLTNDDLAYFFLQRGLDALGAGENLQALSMLQSALGFSPTCPFSRFYLALAHWNLRDFNEAIGQLTIHLHHAPTDQLAIHNLGLMHFHQGNFQQALRHMQRLPLDHPAVQNNLAIVHASLGHHDRAHTLWKAAGNCDARHNLTLSRQDDDLLRQEYLEHCVPEQSASR